MNPSRKSLVGQFIRARRESIHLSQRALGLQLIPGVTTQFISNIERGITSLPVHHVPIMAKALQTSEAELLSIMERDYSSKISHQVGRPDPVSAPSFSELMRNISSQDLDWFKKIFAGYPTADPETQEKFREIVDSFFDCDSGPSLKVISVDAQLIAG